MPHPTRSAPVPLKGRRAPSFPDVDSVSASFLDVSLCAPDELVSPRRAAARGTMELLPSVASFDNGEGGGAANGGPVVAPVAAAAAARPAPDAPGAARVARMPPLGAARQEHENEPAEVVIVCEPEPVSLMMGGLHPRASLYERPVNLDAAKAAHAEFRRVMREAGIKVLTVRDILSYGVESHMGARVDLEELAMRALEYKLAEGADPAAVAESDRVYLTDDYKRRVLEHMSIGQLIDTIMINPTVHLAPSARDTGLVASYQFQPLSNLVYTRDQQVTTCRGVVMARLRSPQRQLEVELMRFALRKLGLPIIGAVEAPGFLEGGDFFPAGRGLALVGVGLRSNVEACQQLMERDLLGTDRLAVVRDEFEQSQDRMHLDCCFSILGDSVCLMLEEMMGEASPTRRLVDEYARPGPGRPYELARSGVEFAAYMRGEGYSIIPVSGEDQLLYGCNVLNLGNSKIISVHAGTARSIVKHPSFRGDVQVIDFGPVTSMYGAVHCASQVVKRTPRQVPKA